MTAYTQRLQLHCKLAKGGSMKSYAIEADGRTIGIKTVFRQTSGQAWETTYRLNHDDTVFTSFKAFIAAYEAKSVEEKVDQRGQPGGR